MRQHTRARTTQQPRCLYKPLTERGFASRLADRAATRQADAQASSQIHAGLPAFTRRYFQALYQQLGPSFAIVFDYLAGEIFQFNIQGEVLTGEATRVSGDERRGIASAFGNRGTSVRCEYQMNTPLQGAGTCILSNGAQYTIHIGS